MAKKEIAYSDAIAEIEKILEKFNSSQMSVDELAADVKRASELICICKKRLTEVKSDVDSALKVDE